MASGEFQRPNVVDALLSKNVPHILEKIFFSLDYKSFKTCFEVNRSWKGLLKSEDFQTKSKDVFKHEIWQDEKKFLNASREGDVETVKRLLSLGLVNVNCDPHPQYEPSDLTHKFDLRNIISQYKTAVHLAAEEGHKDVVKLLLDEGADPHGRKFEEADAQISPLHLAATQGHEDVVKLLIDSGHIVDHEDDDRMTPLHVAAENGHAGVIQLLIDGGAAPNIAESGGRTALSFAAEGGHEDVVKFFIDRGADVTIEERYLMMPLHWAAMNGHKGVVQLLLERGADPNKKAITLHGRRTPLDMANAKGHKDVVQLLCQAETV